MSQPQQTLEIFFKSLAQWQFPVCWRLFSSHSQQQFLRWTLEQLYKRNENAAKAVKLGLPEVKFMFEDPTEKILVRIFWQRFAQKCRASEFIHYAYYETEKIDKKAATVRADLKYPDGRVASLVLNLVQEQGGWKFGYFESGFNL